MPSNYLKKNKRIALNITFNYCINDDLRTVKEALLQIGDPVDEKENKPITKAKSYAP